MHHLNQMIIDGLRPVVVFKKSIGDLETYCEGGMKARIINCKKAGPFSGSYELVFSFEEFDEFNKGFETSNYFDGNGVPCLTARESGLYTPVDSVFFAEDDDWSFYFEILDEQKMKLFKGYSESGDCVTYLEWLEHKVIGAGLV